MRIGIVYIITSRPASRKRLRPVGGLVLFLFKTNQRLDVHGLGEHIVGAER